MKAKDGTLVPLSIVHRKGLKLDGSNPTILYGYGAYGISQTPFYRPTFLPWFNRGGVLAVAHVRGGGEYGEDWYKAGYKAHQVQHRGTTRSPAANGWSRTSTRRRATMAIMGGSAGGIFVGRSITDRPDLFGAADRRGPGVGHAAHGVSHPTGCSTSRNSAPSKTEDGFKGLYAMSTYEHVKDGTKYPAVLLTTGINDPRVDAWEAGKMAARLQAASTSGKPILLRIDFDAGHGFGSTKKSQYEERADTLRVPVLAIRRGGIPAPAALSRYSESFFPAKSASARKIRKMMSAATNRNFAIPALPAAIPVNPKSPATMEMMAKMIAHLIMDRSVVWLSYEWPHRSSGLEVACNKRRDTNFHVRRRTTGRCARCSCSGSIVCWIRGRKRSASLPAACATAR